MKKSPNTSAKGSAGLPPDLVVTLEEKKVAQARAALGRGLQAAGLPHLGEVFRRLKAALTREEKVRMDDSKPIPFRRRRRR